MKRTALAVCMIVAGALAMLAPGSAFAVSTSGTWSSGDGTDAPLVQSATYSTTVRPPINADGSSNFPKKRGAIPVQFSLSRTPGPFVLQSICGGEPIGQPGCLFDGTGADDYGFVSFEPAQPFTFADVTSLISDYTFTSGNCHGGALRWSLSLDTNGDSVRDGSAWLYYGNVGPFADCTTSNNQSGVNMMTLTDGRWDTTQLSGGGYGETLAQTRAKFDTATVLRASLVLDGGWAGDQVVALGSAIVNDNAFPIAAAVPSPTCDLPQAKIEVVKNDPTPSGPVNETPASVQNADAGIYFRQVDCKYIYNLDVSALGDVATRAGTFRIYANIGGTRVTTSPARFDLR